MNSEARKRAAGIAASVPTAQEPTPTLGDAPGDDSEALAALLTLHRRPAEALTVFGEAWMVCGCGERIDIPVRDGRVSQREMHQLHDAHATAAVLASSWLADHDRQTAATAWFAGYDKGNLDGYFGTSDERAKSPYSDLDPYSEEARRG
jgi:hypothetical protein